MYRSCVLTLNNKNRIVLDIVNYILATFLSFYADVFILVLKELNSIVSSVCYWDTGQDTVFSRRHINRKIPVMRGRQNIMFLGHLSPRVRLRGADTFTDPEAMSLCSGTTMGKHAAVDPPKVRSVVWTHPVAGGPGNTVLPVVRHTCCPLTLSVTLRHLIPLFSNPLVTQMKNS